MKKLIIIISLIFVFLPHYGNAQVVIHARQTHLSEILIGLSDDYGLQYSYKGNIANDCLLDIENSFSSLESALQSILALCEIQYQKLGEVYLIEAAPKVDSKHASLANSHCVFNGRLYDAESGQALAAVVIEYEGGKTLSDQNGYFTLMLPQDQNRVQFSHVVYQSLDTFLSDNQVNRLALNPQNHFLDEVLIEAQDTSLKEDYGVPLLKAIYGNNLAVGFCLNFEELAANQPSRPYRTYPEKRKSHEIDQIGWGEFYRFKFSRDSAKQIDSIYGFSDGKHVYININAEFFKHHSRFVKAKIIGPFAYLRYSGPGGIDGYGNYIGDEMIREVIDLRSGERKPLNKHFLRPLLAADPALSAEYERKIFKGTIGEAFLIRFYERASNTKNQ